MDILLKLPYDILVDIAEHVDSFIDFVALRGVCMLWRSAAIDVKKFDFLSLPWLLLAQNDDDLHHRQYYTFFSSITHNHDLKKIELPEVNDEVNRGFSSKSWLITVSNDYSVTLLNPLSREQIQFPNLTISLKFFIDHDHESFPAIFVHKVVISSSSWNHSNLVVMVIYGQRFKLAFCKLRHGVCDQSWTDISTRPSMYSDVIYYNDQFYAIDTQGDIVVCDVAGPNPTVGNIVATLPRNLLRRRFSEKSYLVQSSVLGKVLVVSREGVPDLGVDFDYKTTAFQVFEVDLSCNKWTELKDMGDLALFLGNNSSFSLVATTTKGMIKSNCIYFTDDCWVRFFHCNNKIGGKDMGLYNLEDGSITSHFDGKSYSNVTPPMWIEPIIH